MTWIARYWSRKKTIVPIATENRSRCSRTRTSSESPCSLKQAATKKTLFSAETGNEVLRSCFETISPSHGPLEHVADDDFTNNSRFLYFCTDPENGSTSSRRPSLVTTILSLLFAEAERKGQ